MMTNLKRWWPIAALLVVGVVAMLTIGCNQSPPVVIEVPPPGPLPSIEDTLVPGGMTTMLRTIEVPDSTRECVLEWIEEVNVEPDHIRLAILANLGNDWGLWHHFITEPDTVPTFIVVEPPRGIDVPLLYPIRIRHNSESFLQLHAESDVGIRVIEPYGFHLIRNLPQWEFHPTAEPLPASGEWEYFLRIDEMPNGNFTAGVDSSVTP